MDTMGKYFCGVPIFQTAVTGIGGKPFGMNIIILFQQLKQF